DDQVGVVLLAHRVPEDRQLANVQTDPKANAAVSVDHVGNDPLGFRVKPFDCEERPLPIVISDDLTEGAESVTGYCLVGRTRWVKLLQFDDPVVLRLTHKPALFLTNESDEACSSAVQVGGQDPDRPGSKTYKERIDQRLNRGPLILASRHRWRCQYHVD